MHGPRVGKYSMWVGGRACGCVVGFVDGWVSGCLCGWVGEWVSGRAGGWVGGRVGECVDIVLNPMPLWFKQYCTLRGLLWVQYIIVPMLQRGRTFVDVNEVVDASSFFPSFDMIPIYKSTPASQPLDSDLNDRYKAEYERMDQTFTSTAPSQHVKVPNVLGGRYKAEYERMGHTFTSTAHSQHIKVPNVFGGVTCRRL